MQSSNDGWTVVAFRAGDSTANPLMFFRRWLANPLQVGSVLPGVLVIEGDARALPNLVPRHWRGRIASVVCGILLVLLPRAEQRRFIEAIEAVAPGRGFLHDSDCVTSPLPYRKHGLAARRQAWTPLNSPPRQRVARRASGQRRWFDH